MVLVASEPIAAGAEIRIDYEDGNSGDPTPTPRPTPTPTPKPIANPTPTPTPIPNPNQDGTEGRKLVLIGPAKLLEYGQAQGYLVRVRVRVRVRVGVRLS